MTVGTLHIFVAYEWYTNLVLELCLPTVYDAGTTLIYTNTGWVGNVLLFLRMDDKS